MPKSKRKLDLSMRPKVTQDFVADLQQALAEHRAFLERDYPSDVLRSFHLTYLEASLLSKFVSAETDPAELRRRRAIEKWLAVERANRKTNVRLLSSETEFNFGQSAKVPSWTVLSRAAKYVRELIGDEPPSDLFEGGEFTNGASTSRKRSPATLVSKFVGKLDTTLPAWDHFLKVIPEFETWLSYNEELLYPRFVRGNVLFTVPKTTVIDRVACKEPDVNIFLQRAVGIYIRKRLKRQARIDLKDQSINRDLAHRASIDGSLATIDLSSASDSLCTSLVFLLLPAKWFALLDDLRSPRTFIDGASHVNEMFSSMGNGFTFELESMVFWALARASCYFAKARGRISVYGDDIIIPSGVAPAFLCLLEYCGFHPNVKKTFITGPFRESCGGHYYRGLDVTPFYLRRPFADVSDLILTLNQLRKWLLQTETDMYDLDSALHNSLTRVWEKYSRLVPRPLHGGADLTSRVQLVATCKPKCELKPTKRASERLERTYQTGMYLSRLCLLNKVDRSPYVDPFEKDLREIGAATFSGLPIPTGSYVMIRCKVEPSVFGRVPPALLFEQIRWVPLTPKSLE